VVDGQTSTKPIWSAKFATSSKVATNFGTQKIRILSKIFKNESNLFDLCLTEKTVCYITKRELRKDDVKNRNLDGGIDLVDGENTAQLLGKFLNL
jgi:hypothetical protein